MGKLKKIILVVFLILFFSCKNNSNFTKEKSFFYLGDTIITNSKLIDSINNTCDMKNKTFEDYSEKDWKDYDKKCIVSILDEKYSNLKINKSPILIIKDIEVHVKNIENENNPQIYLYTYKNNEKIDSLAIYGERVTSIPSTLSKYYYITKNNEILILSVISLDNGTFFKNKETYKINLQTGKFELVESIEN